jgi:hypothetical protein
VTVVDLPLPTRPPVRSRTAATPGSDLEAGAGATARAVARRE